jgi:molybdopterin molybdotransferase
MIPVEEAKEIIRQVVKSLTPVELLLHKTAGLVLSEDIYATLDIPAFEQSSMDGYALRFAESSSPILRYASLPEPHCLMVQIPW